MYNVSLSEDSGFLPAFDSGGPTPLIVRVHKSGGTVFVTVPRNIFSAITAVFLSQIKCVSVHMHGAGRARLTVTFTGNYRNVDPQYGHYATVSAHKTSWWILDLWKICRLLIYSKRQTLLVILSAIPN
jgi:hypothetical protein